MYMLIRVTKIAQVLVRAMEEIETRGEENESIDKVKVRKKG